MAALLAKTHLKHHLITPTCCTSNKFFQRICTQGTQLSPSLKFPAVFSLPQHCKFLSSVCRVILDIQQTLLREWMQGWTGHSPTTQKRVQHMVHHQCICLGNKKVLFFFMFVSRNLIEVCPGTCECWNLSAYQHFAYHNTLLPCACGYWFASLLLVTGATWAQNTHHLNC